MRKFYLVQLLAIVLILLSGCQKADQVEQPKTDPLQPARIVNSDQAKVFAQQALGALLSLDGETPMTKTVATRTSETRSGGVVVEDVVTLSSNGVPALYVANFANNGGFMAISADKSQPNPMVTFSDKGRFDISMLKDESPFAAYINGKIEDISINISKGDGDIEDFNKWASLGNIIVNENGEEEETTLGLVSVESLGDDVRLDVLEKRQEEFPETRGRYGTSKGLSYVSPGISYWIEWGQSKGYNADAPRPNVDLAGCAAVAIGKVCFMHKFPKYYEFSKMPYNIDPTTVSNPISRMLRDIGDKIPYYNWGSSATGASESSMLSCLRTLGYTSTQLMSYDFYRTYTSMRDGYPVILTATGWTGDGSRYVGHAWLCNGYQEFVWKITTTKRFLGIIVSKKVRYEYADYLYMNWGWFGSGNTWVDQEDWRAQHSTGEIKWNGNRNGFYYIIPKK